MPRRNPDDVWRHDMFEGSDLRERLGNGIGNSGPVRNARAGPPQPHAYARPQVFGLSGSRVATSALRAAVGPTGFATRQSTAVSIVGTAAGPSKITVANLHPSASAEDVKTVFSEFGNILQCSLSIDSQGSGFAEIVFDNRKSTLAAIQKYHNQIADGKTLQVLEVSLGLSIAGASKSIAPDASDQNHRARAADLWLQSEFQRSEGECIRIDWSRLQL
ncbi:hypothetical protein BC829DRAFT_133480 [Chytridium lagenaria]|nr:hypothetical protein BC829DRAFT_133480 [Chytridium lagenaria]